MSCLIHQFEFYSCFKSILDTELHPVSMKIPDIACTFPFIFLTCFIYLQSVTSSLVKRKQYLIESEHVISRCLYVSMNHSLALIQDSQIFDGYKSTLHSLTYQLLPKFLQCETVRENRKETGIILNSLKFNSRVPTKTYYVLSVLYSVSHDCELTINVCT